MSEQNAEYAWEVTVDLELPEGSGQVGALIHSTLDRKRFHRKWQARWYAFKLTNKWPSWAIRITQIDRSEPQS